MRKLTSVLVFALSGTSISAYAGGPAFPEALPPVANPGECYGQVRIPAQYSTGSETVISQDAHARLDVTEPQLAAREETVLTKEASIRYEVRQPRYRTIRERILTPPAYDRLSVSPPQFSTVTEQLQTSAPHLVWKRGNPAELQRQGYVIHSTADGRLVDRSGHHGSTYNSTQHGGDICGAGCEIWCLVEEPGTSVTTTRRVMTSPSRVSRTPVAAQYQTLTKQIVDDPGGVREVPIPAEYSTVTVQELIRPAEAYEVNVPAEYGNVQTKVLISPERYEWRRVLCQPGTGSIGTQSYSGTYSGAGQSQYGSSSSYGRTTYGSSSQGYSTQGHTSQGNTSWGHTTQRSTAPSTPSYGSSTNYGVQNSDGIQSGDIGRRRHGPHRRRTW